MNTALQECCLFRDTKFSAGQPTCKTLYSSNQNLAFLYTGHIHRCSCYIILMNNTFSSIICMSESINSGLQNLSYSMYLYCIYNGTRTCDVHCQIPEGRVLFIIVGRPANSDVNLQYLSRKVQFPHDYRVLKIIVRSLHGIYLIRVCHTFS